MNDQERLKALLDRAANIEGLDQPRVDRLIAYTTLANIEEFSSGKRAAELSNVLTEA